MSMKMTVVEFEVFCKKHTAKEAAELLLKYVKKDEPNSFLPGLSTRSMCGIAAKHFKNRFGGNFCYMDFYYYMWGSGEKCMGEESKENRKSRHIRCGIPLD